MQEIEKKKDACSNYNRFGNAVEFCVSAWKGGRQKKRNETRARHQTHVSMAGRKKCYSTIYMYARVYLHKGICDTQLFEDPLS